MDEITLCSKKIDKISNAFVSLINNISSQHKRHLKHIFKKKWRPEKVKLDGKHKTATFYELELIRINNGVFHSIVFFIK